MKASIHLPVNILEGIERRFLRLIAASIGMVDLNFAIDSIIDQLYFISLKTLRDLAVHVFLHGRVNGRIESSTLLAKINLRISGVIRP